MIIGENLSKGNAKKAIDSSELTVLEPRVKSPPVTFNGLLL